MMLQVAMAQPGSFASLRFMEPPPDGSGASDAADIGQPDALQPRDMAKGASWCGCAVAICR
jgi:hypothetical protein